MPGRAATAVDAAARQVRVLTRATISWNVLEAVVALAAGGAASSAALLGFGLDSLVEVCSAAAVAWQFAARTVSLREARERVTVRVVAVSFFALAGVVTADAVGSLAGSGEARPSAAGIGLAAASLVVMPVLSAAQRRARRALGSVSVVADSRQALLCTYLSLVLLAGLVVNAALGWAWADPRAALVIAAVALREGVQAWRGEGCCSPQACGCGSPACAC